MKKLIRSIANSLGYDVRRIDRSRIPDEELFPSYERLKPSIRYSPWNLDDAFVRTYNQVGDRTLVDRVRCFELWRLVEQSSKLESGSLMEIGVWRGGAGALIAQQANNCGISDPVYLCDTFSGVVKAGDEDSSYDGGEHSDVAFESVEDLLFREMGLANAKLLKGVFPDETGVNVGERLFRFCHIDVDVYRSARDVMNWIWPRLVRGGLVVFDDYGFQSCDGITKAVEEDLLAEDRILFCSISGHAIMMKLY